MKGLFQRVEGRICECKYNKGHGEAWFNRLNKKYGEKLENASKRI